MPLADLGLEFLAWWQAALVWLALAVPTVWLGRKRLEALGTTRRNVAIIARLMVLALAILILAGLRAERDNDTVELIVVRDTSDSARQAVDAARGETVIRRVVDYLAENSVGETDKQPDDRIGIVSFDADAYVDQMPNSLPQATGSTATAVNRGTSGTDPSEAINLALATMSPDVRGRILLVWDGNKTEGDLDAAVERAKQAGVPIDVMPLNWAAGDEVFVEDFYAPTWRREGEPFTLEIILSNTSTFNASGTLRVEQEGRPLDLDPTTPGVQAGRPVTLKSGRNKQLVVVDALPGERANVRRFRASFEPNRTRNTDGTVSNIGDGLVENNSASAFTFVRGKGRVLYVDNAINDRGAILADELAGEQVAVDRVGIGGFPTNLVDLQAYDAIILANVPARRRRTHRASGSGTEPVRPRHRRWPDHDRRARRIRCRWLAWQCDRKRPAARHGRAESQANSQGRAGPGHALDRDARGQLLGRTVRHCRRRSAQPRR